jgi:hypothetical protein
MKATTVSRRQMLASVPAATAALGLPAAAGANAPPVQKEALQDNGDYGPRGANAPIGIADDPVFAAIERHRQATQALSAQHEPSDALVTQLSRAEVGAFLAWLTTPPATLAGVIATLEYASHRRVSDSPDDHVYANLAEAAQYIPGEDDPDDILKAGERFPAMVAAALRKIRN